MKTRTRGDVTPQRKIIGITDKFNNAGIKKQQGTTRALYDSLPVDGRTEFRFFEEAQNRQFPFSNMGADGNRLGVGNAIAIERSYITLFEYDDATLTFSNIQSFEAAGWVEGQLGEKAIEIANSQVLKRLPYLSSSPNYNKNACHTAYHNFEYDTQTVVNPLFEFVVKFRVPAYIPLLNTYVRMTIEGTGAIISPRATQ